MSKRGVKPKGKINIEWSENFSYGIGLLVSDGNLSPNGRHICFTSRDLDQINNFLEAFKISNIKIGKIINKRSKKTAFRVQFGDVNFYKFLVSIGVGPAKSKTIGEVKIPRKYIFDFLRGSFDGDGTFYSYFDPRWNSSFMFYTEFVSASETHIEWLKATIQSELGINGHVTNRTSGSVIQLKYAKKESLKLISKMYTKSTKLFLKRKKLKIDQALRMMGKLQIDI